jgi:hypothetical protein
MALAWTDNNGTEIKSFQPHDPIHPLQSGACPVTSQLKLITSTSMGVTWKVASLDIHGTPKTVGGDEFYVTYKDNNAIGLPSGHPTAIAHVNDQGDGTYELDFHMSPFSSVPLQDMDGSGNDSGSSGGTLTFSMQYTCGVGMIPNNDKMAWGSGGLLGRIIYQVPVPTRPFITQFVEPNKNKAIDLGKYKQVLVFGDSNMQAFSQPITKLCRNTEDENHKKCNMKYNTNVNSQLSRNSVKKRFLPMIRNMIHNATTLQGDGNGYALEEMALVVGSSAWDLIYDVRQGVHFLNHRRAVQSLLTTLQKEYPTLSLYWRSALAVHTQAATNVRDDWKDIAPLWYLSTSRSRKLYEYQKEIVNRIPNVTHLDVYHASYLSAEYMGRGDARHFTQEWNEIATNWFYK